MLADLPAIMWAVLWLALTAYVLLGGADFGGGIWDLLANGRLADRQREAIAEAMGPVWEANHVWLIFLIVGLFTCFPGAFVPLSVALSVPLTLALVGIVLRGAAFAFRAHAAEAVRLSSTWGRVFGIASVMTPALFGMCAGAVAAGRIRVAEGQLLTAGWIATWTTPLCLLVGALALALCAHLAAVYLAVEAADLGDDELRLLFQRRAVLSGLVAGAIAVPGLIVAHADSPVLWAGLAGNALPLVTGSIALAAVALVLLHVGRVRAARLLMWFQVAGLVWAWGVAQFPAIVVPDVTVWNAASPAPTLVAFAIATGAGMLLLLPSLWLLFRVFKGRNPAAERDRLAL